MSPEKLFHELLHLGSAWRVVRIGFHPDGGVQLRVEATDAFWLEARSIHVEDGAVRCYDHIEDVTWRHLNVFEHRCTIVCRLPRAQCVKSGKVYRVTPPWEGLSKAFTKESDTEVEEDLGEELAALLDGIEAGGPEEEGRPILLNQPQTLLQFALVPQFTRHHALR